jgi:hypothetical protein
MSYGMAVFGILQLFTGYECGCCGRKVANAEYRAGAFMCLECARGEHRHPGWGSQAA